MLPPVKNGPTCRRELDPPSRHSPRPEERHRLEEDERKRIEADSEAFTRELRRAMRAAPQRARELREQAAGRNELDGERSD